MSVPTFIPFLDPYKVYAQAGGVAQPNATTMQQMQNLFGNWSDVLATFVKCLWQPSKAYVVNQIVWSPSMPANTVAICTKAGTSGSSEPSWPRLVNGTASDGGATWKLIEAHPQTLPANGGTAEVAENAKKLGGELPAYYATAANLDLKAPIANPTFTGVPTGPTAAPGTNTTQLATTAFVATALSSLTGQGKIVAYNLAQNGYVKWDIGLILQWGMVTTRGSDVGSSRFTYPISLSVCYTAVASSVATTTGASIGSGFVNTLGNSSCNVVHERTSGFTIIVIGR